MRTMPDPTDSLATRPSLLSAMVRQDEHAWEEFNRLYGSRVRRVAEARGLNREEAQDVYQQVLVEIWRQIGNLDRSRQAGRGFFRAWLFIKTRWRSDDARKRRDRQMAAAVDDETGTALVEKVADPVALSPGALTDLELAQEIDARIRDELARRVDTKQLRAFYLRRYENWTALRVAEYLEVPGRVVDVWVHRVQKRYDEELSRIVKRYY